MQTMDILLPQNARPPTRYLCSVNQYFHACDICCSALCDLLALRGQEIRAGRLFDGSRMGELWSCLNKREINEKYLLIGFA